MTTESALLIFFSVWVFCATWIVAEIIKSPYIMPEILYLISKLNKEKKLKGL